MTKVGGSTSSGEGVRSIMNALGILEALAERQPIGVSELAREVGMPKSSVQRTLRTLDQAGWAEPDGSAVLQWRLTRKVFRVGLSGSIAKTLPEAARRHHTTLRDTYRETVHLTVADGDHVIVIARVDGTNSLRTFLEVGTQAPILNSAGGRAILSRMAPEITQGLLEQPIQAHTSATITDREVIKAQVEEARERGYATNEAEWRSGIAAIAAPIVAPDGEVLGAVSLSMPTSRYQTLDVPAVGAHIAEFCAQIAASVHYRL